MQVSQRLLAVELAPVLLQTFQDPFAPSPAMGLATPASQQVSKGSPPSIFHTTKHHLQCLDMRFSQHWVASTHALSDDFTTQQAIRSQNASLGWSQHSDVLLHQLSPRQLHPQLQQDGMQVSGSSTSESPAGSPASGSDVTSAKDTDSPGSGPNTAQPTGETHSQQAP